MPDSCSALRALYYETLEQISSPDQWQTFLKTAAYNYKLEFHEQAMVFAQKPDATIVMPASDWQKYSRNVIEEKAILILDVLEDKTYSLFDISDTALNKENISVPVFQISPNTRQVLSYVNSALDLEEKELSDAVFTACDLATEQQLENVYDEAVSVLQETAAITEWNNIVAVYSVRAQNAGFVAAEMSEENISLLRETMWDMVTFSTSSEAVTVPESDEETGSEEESAATVGVVTVNYLTMDEAAQLYNFTEDDQELLVMVLQMSTGGGYIGGSGNGMMINPCPEGTFNGNDYPYYPSGGYHAGRDIACPIGTPVYAAAGGTVIHINDQADTYGNHIMIAHGNEVYTLYAHCSELLVSVGDEVVQGQQIAWSGNTGNTTGPHLHFEVRVGGSQYRVNNVDPLEWIG